ncbi:MAG: GNAT family N-acetyltransferase [Candidatus Melainabacteria bacterium]|mgnify:CR=1 FL=1|nr:GNAT family N-acetyltransferase [Candidatus Melainabacteria bacterium]
MVSRPEPLTKDHVLDQFDCGKEPLTGWLKKHALQSQAAQHSKTMVIAEDQVVIGYYSYNVISVEHEETTPGRVKKGLAKHPIPVFLIARLALDTKHQGKGLGARLLCHALKGAAAIAAADEGVPIRAVIVDAIDDEAKKFYTGFDFVPFPADTLRMWLLMKDLMATLKVNAQKRNQ